MNKFTYAHKCSLVSNTLINTHTYRERYIHKEGDRETLFTHMFYTSTHTHTHTGRHTFHTHTHTHTHSHTHTHTERHTYTHSFLHKHTQRHLTTHIHT